MNAAKNATVSIFLHRLLDTRGPPRDDMLDARDITAQVNIDLIAAVPEADYCAGRRAERGVCAQVVLFVRCRIEERGPAGVSEADV